MLFDTSTTMESAAKRGHTTCEDSPAIVRPFGSPQTTAIQVAVNEARVAQAEWSETPIKHRLAIARRWRHLLAQRTQSVARTVDPTLRRREADTLVAEILPLADACRFLEHEAPQLLAPRYYNKQGRPRWLQGVRLEIHRDPFGVVLIVGPRNYPLFLPGVQILQALIAGNAVLLKPGTRGTAAAHALRDLWLCAGLDPRLLSIIPESPEAARSAFHSGIDKVVVTGSSGTGVAVLRELAQQVIPAVCELSGCDAVFVQPDADLDVVSAALRFGLQFNGSETCIAPRRVFLHPSLLDEVASRMRCALASSVYQPLPSQVTTLVTHALAAGARVVSGATPTPERYAPLVLGDITPSMALVQADIPAPLIALIPVSSDEEALTAAAACPYALGAAVFGRGPTAQAFARRVQAGVVVVNDLIVPTADPRVPFAGRKRSGFGVTRGAEGLLELTTVKAISIRHGRWLPHFDPPTPNDLELFRTYIEWSHSGTWRACVRGVMGLLRAMSKQVVNRYHAPQGAIHEN